MKNRSLHLLMVMVLGIVLLTGCSGNKDASNAATKTADLTGADTSNNSDSSKETEIFVFIAASLSNAMGKIQEQYKDVAPNITLILNADSSGTLQTQIEEGAECDVFFSAAMKQMNALDEGGYVETDSIKKLLENKVVLIKPTNGETKVTGFENIYDAKNLALAGEDVPVGAYAREIFQNLGIWDKVSAMEINEGANVTAVLAAVSEASNEVGVVYATDANSVKDSVEVIAEAPEGSLQTPVLYPVGIVKNTEANEDELAAAKAFIDYLSTEEAIAVFEEYGFSAYVE